MGHENEFSELYQEINTWSNKTFGSDRSEQGIVVHLELEIDELWEAIDKWKKGWREKDEIYGELADIMILVINLSGKLGLSSDQLLRAVRSKMAINREREWVKYPDGTFRHKKGGE